MPKNMLPGRMATGSAPFVTTTPNATAGTTTTSQTAATACTASLFVVENCQAIDDHVALLFTSSDASATLKEHLYCGEEETRTTVAAAAAGTSGEESVSLRHTYGGSGHKLRSAMKSAYSSRDRGENHEERWVRFSEVVKKEEVISNYRVAAAATGGLLSLSQKLDYQEILDAWSNKSSLFIHRGSGMTDWLTSGANLWTVPEKDEIGDVVDKKGRMRQREASVLRYKEKRHNRLFAKRIRHEVRKFNAEKRPRVKGRFVRRNDKD